MLGNIKYKNGFFYIGLALSGLVLVTSILALLAVFGFAGGRTSVLFIATIGSTTPLLFCTYWLLSKGLGEKALANTAGKIIKKDFAYLGLLACDFNLIPSPTERQEPFDIYSSQTYLFSEHRIQDKNSTFKKILYYSNTPKKTNFSSRIEIQGGKLIFDTMGFLENKRSHVNYLLSILKLEEKVISNLEKQKNSSSYQFDKGLPLATYLILSEKCDKQVERALFFKHESVSPLKVYLINKLSLPYEDIATYLRLPESWLIKLLSNQNMEEPMSLLVVPTC